MRPFILAIISVLTIAYPALVYYGINTFKPAFFGVLFLLAAIAKFFYSKNKSDPLSVIALVGVAAYSLILAVFNTEWLLRLYPVVVSWGVATVFALSLRKEVTLIESFAIAAGKTITDNAKRYTRKLTLLWALLLLVNGLISLYLAALGTLQAWALYCGLLSYLLIGSFFLGEYQYRRYYIKKMGE
jgi:uncharacterized membrane protein